jgi:hypothetical protein
VRVSGLFRKVCGDHPVHYTRRLVHQRRAGPGLYEKSPANCVMAVCTAGRCPCSHVLYFDQVAEQVEMSAPVATGTEGHAK